MSTILLKQGNHFLENDEENKEIIKLNDLYFKPYINALKIQESVRNIAFQITRDYMNGDTSPVFLGILKGCSMFMMDLIRMIDPRIHVEITYIQSSSYGSETISSGIVKVFNKPDISLNRRNVIVIDDIVDTGQTMNTIIDMIINEYHPISIEFATLLFKESFFKGTTPPKYIGMIIPPDFVVGYGLDYAEQGRQLPDIYVKVSD